MRAGIAAALAVVAVLAVAVPSAWYLAAPRAAAGKPASITVGIKDAEANALIYIALQRGYFVQDNLNVTLKPYATKLQAFNGMLTGETDLAVITEYPVVGAVFKGERISIVGSTSRFHDQYLVGNRSGGMLAEQDLAGKRIGVPRGTIGEFYLGRFLNLHGLGLSEVTLANVPFATSAGALLNGSVDAAMTYDGAPGSYELIFGDNWTAWPAQSGQESYDVLVCQDPWLAVHHAELSRLLGSLVRAARYLAENPAGGKGIVKNLLNRTDEQLDTIWPRFQFSVTIQESLVLAMEDEARWMIQNNLTASRAMPDFLDNIYDRALKEASANSVSIIR